MENVYLQLQNFVTFDMEPDVLASTLAFAQTQEYQNNMNNHVFMFNGNAPAPLMDWINKCLVETKQAIYSECSADLVVSQIWMNRASKMHYHHKHDHPNSIVSGIIYLNDDYAGGETIFYIDNPWYDLHNKRYMLLGAEKRGYYNSDTIKPRAGRMVLFPSHVVHSVSPVRDTGTRYTVAFNTYMSGNLGTVDSLTHLGLTI